MMRKWSKAPRILALLTVMLAAALGFAPTAGAEGAGELQGKIDAAESGSTIVLDKDYTESVTIRNGKKITLDLAGKTLTAASGAKAIVVDGGALVLIDSNATSSPAVSQDYETVTYDSGKVIADKTAVSVINGGSFTMNSGTVESNRDCGVYAGAKDGAAGSFVMNGGYIKAQEYGIGVMNEGATVTVAGGVVVANDNAALAGNGTPGMGGTTITVSGGTLIGHIVSPGYIACGIYHPQSGALNISGGTIYADGGVGVLARAGSANITGGEIIATGSAAGWVGDKKFDIPSSAIVVDRAAGYPGAADGDVVTISGDAVVTADKGQEALQVFVKNDAPKTDLIEVTGGSFSTPVDQDFLGEGYNPTQQPDGSYGVHKHTLVKVDAVAPTCETDGVLAHWKCSSCGDLFLDEAMTKPTDNVVDPKLGHSAAKVPAKDPTIEAEGNIEYWHCAACDSYFADAQLTKKLSSKADTVLAKLPKEFTVTFDDGVHDPTTVKVKDGELVAKPKDPEHDGWKFVGWFTTKAADGTVSGEWDFGKDAVTADMALYGGWKKIEAGETEKPQNKLPQTGDTSAIGVVVLGVAGVAAAAAGALISKRRKAE